MRRSTVRSKGSADLGACGDASSCGFSETSWGWTAGAGVEWRFSRAWSAKAEYLYVRLGSPSFNGNRVTADNTHFQVARIGVNYHF